VFKARSVFESDVFCGGFVDKVRLLNFFGVVNMVVVCLTFHVRIENLEEIGLTSGCASKFIVTLGGKSHFFAIE
jgi:hypothetical protein